MGGVGWRFVTEDGDCERQVAEWMGDHLAARGVEAALQAVSPQGEATLTHPSMLEKWLMHNVYHFTLHGDEENLFNPSQAVAQTPPQPGAAHG
jgi:hypothetical protein